jgi:uncharacterized SAM-binding protein YcdF (DUF218 family)
MLEQSFFSSGYHLFPNLMKFRHLGISVFGFSILGIGFLGFLQDTSSARSG